MSKRDAPELFLNLGENAIAHTARAPLRAQLLKYIEWRSAQGDFLGITAVASAASCCAGQMPL
jgi:hypothetical protein